MDQPVTNPVAITPTSPPTRGPIIGQGPVTDNPLVNTAMGMSVVGASQAGFMAVTGEPFVLATSVFLNLISQLFKGFRWFPEHKGLIVLMLVVSFVVSYFIIAPTALEGVERLRDAFVNMASSTMQALLNYKADKAAGLNVMPPVPQAEEFANRLKPVQTWNTYVEGKG